MPLKILIADDSATDRLIIKSMLQDYQVVTANDGLEAMQIIDTDQDIQLVVLDLNMPVMDGFEVLSALNEDSRYQSIRVIILTNYDEIESEIKGLKLGAIDYIRKPVHIESLRARIEVHSKLLEVENLLKLRLHDQELTFDTVFYQAPMGITISHNRDSLGKGINDFTDINPAFEKITCRPKEELIRLGWAAITHPDDLEEELKLYNRFKSGEIESYSMDKRYVRPDGSCVWVHVVVADLTLSNQKKDKHICLVQDITKRKEVENTLRYNNEHDSWTGLFNRRYLEMLLADDIIMTSGTKRALIGINLSSIHSLNLIFGFHYSHELISRIAKALQEFVNNDHMLFNIYENHFAFYVKNYQNKMELSSFCTRISVILRQMLTIERINAGIGVVEIENEPDQDADLLFRRMLIASERAVERFDDYAYSFFDSIMEAEITRADVIMRELAEIAGGSRPERLSLLFQPLLDLRTNQIAGFEALARLNSSHYGDVSPLEFIPMAEEMKAIIPLGEQIIRLAFSFLNKINAISSENMNISINISAIQLLKDGFVPKLRQVIDETGINPYQVTLEITESILAVNYQEINSILGQIKLMGVKIAIDDFGTGYSSLARESELNINCLKIDKSFIDKLMQLDIADTITGDIISIAHKFGHYVVAEGVEHQRQKDYLRQLGCDLIQGYLISRPVPEQEALELIKNSHYQEQTR